MAKISDFQLEVEKVLDNFSKETREKISTATKEAAEEAVKYLKSNSPMRTGKYAKQWYKRKQSSTGKADSYVIANRNYRLPHLLERPHRIVRGKGGMTKGQPHIEPAVEVANKKIDEVMSRD